MNIIKRKILLEDSIDRTYNSPTYGTLTATSFYLKVLLTQSSDDMGIFTDMDYEIGPSGLTESDFYDFGGKNISGFTDSKIDDVRSYNANTPYRVNFDVQTEDYLDFDGNLVSGVDRVTQVGAINTYVIGTDKNDPSIGTTGQTSGLLYQDFSGQTRTIDDETIIGMTSVDYIGQGWNQTNTSLSALTKEEYLFGIISPPEVQSDVFIDRGETSVIEKHLKMSEISNLGELERYGNKFYKLNKL
jgi:hypothetical protein